MGACGGGGNTSDASVALQDPSLQQQASGDNTEGLLKIQVNEEQHKTMSSSHGLNKTENMN